MSTNVRQPSGEVPRDGDTAVLAHLGELIGCCDSVDSEWLVLLIEVIPDCGVRKFRKHLRETPGLVLLFGICRWRMLMAIADPLVVEGCLSSVS